MGSKHVRMLKRKYKSTHTKYDKKTENCCSAWDCVLHYEHSVLISWLPSGVGTVKVTVDNWSYSGVHYINTNWGLNVAGLYIAGRALAPSLACFSSAFQTMRNQIFPPGRRRAAYAVNKYNTKRKFSGMQKSSWDTEKVEHIDTSQKKIKKKIKN